MKLTHFLPDLKAVELTPTKGNAATIGKALASRVRDDGNLLHSITRIRAVKDAIDTALADLKQDTIDELSKYPKGKAVIMDAILEQSEANVKYDYSGTPRWLELKAKEDAAAAERKDLEARLKALKKPTAFTDMDSGETYECFPPVKTSDSTYKVTLSSTNETSPVAALS